MRNVDGELLLGASGRVKSTDWGRRGPRQWV